MKQVILKIDDSAYEQFMGMVSLCPQVEVVCESSITDVMNDRDQCMVYAIQTLTSMWLRLFAKCDRCRRFDFPPIMFT